MKYFLYILKSEVCQRTYTGITNNLERRLAEHNSKKSFYTRRYVPWSMIYHEEYATLKDARKREKYFKSAVGRKFIRSLFEQK